MAMQKLSELRTRKVLVLLLDSSGANPRMAIKMENNTKNIKLRDKNVQK